MLWSIVSSVQCYKLGRSNASFDSPALIALPLPQVRCQPRPFDGNSGSDSCEDSSARAKTGYDSPLAQKRLVKERQNLMQERQELEDCGIHVHWGEELNKALALIIGPTGTPYQRGFYFFDIKMPDNYPFVPPKVDFKTGDGRVRFNPNLYVEGKVCLSILGTWSGPSWTTSCSLRTVLVSIQSLLNEHPIQ
ncbi:unnamed protein product, partial [Prorocentrum cordatum]